ncbi:hypothetical protein HMPREF9445_00595 [Bacteroides clarus YIT 12056]|uniref:Uncharacterized protein n=1 Tax=Bacteroides clarus YIT 12056 TaxID=762984 RepID=A0ABN0CRS0_9BACE|nr:hypothetical protein HMPREF9445_00595 [Bacteroides clarus YIT 12056]
MNKYIIILKYRHLYSHRILIKSILPMKRRRKMTDKASRPANDEFLFS